MKRLVFDLDGAIALDDPARSYAEREPNLPLIARLREYRAQGFTIVVASARNMRTYGGDIGKINANTLTALDETVVDVEHQLRPAQQGESLLEAADPAVAEAWIAFDQRLPAQAIDVQRGAGLAQGPEDRVAVDSLGIGLGSLQQGREVVEQFG